MGNNASSSQDGAHGGRQLRAASSVTAGVLPVRNDAPAHYRGGRADRSRYDGSTGVYRPPHARSHEVLGTNSRQHQQPNCRQQPHPRYNTANQLVPRSSLHQAADHQPAKNDPPPAIRPAASYSEGIAGARNYTYPKTGSACDRPFAQRGFSESGLEVVVDQTHAPPRNAIRQPPRPVGAVAPRAPGQAPSEDARQAVSELDFRLFAGHRPSLSRVDSLAHIMDRQDAKQISAAAKTVLFSAAVKEQKVRSRMSISAGTPQDWRNGSDRNSSKTVGSDSSSGARETMTEPSRRSSNVSRTGGSGAGNFSDAGAALPETGTVAHLSTSAWDPPPLDTAAIGELPNFRTARAKSMVKCNSCSTLFVDSTLSKGDLNTTLHCISLALLATINCNHELGLLETDDIFSEQLFPLLADRAISYPDRQPTEQEIFNFLESLFEAASLNAEVAIITLVYIERLLAYTDITLHACNWTRVLLGGLLLACKVWDDQAVWNADFCKIFPAVKVSDMNKLERWYICAIHHDVSIKASVYAKYYFELRDVAARTHRSFELRPLSIREARRLETRSFALSKMETRELSPPGTPRQLDSDPKMRRTKSDNLFVPNTPAALM